MKFWKQELYFFLIWMGSAMAAVGLYSFSNETRGSSIALIVIGFIMATIGWGFISEFIQTHSEEPK